MESVGSQLPLGLPEKHQWLPWLRGHLVRRHPGLNVFLTQNTQVRLISGSLLLCYTSFLLRTAHMPLPAPLLHAVTAEARISSYLSFQMKLN